MLLNKIQGLEEFESSEIYSQFLADDFDVKSITSSAVQCAAVAEYLVKLSNGISLLDKALHVQVSNSHEDLLAQATEIETFEGVLSVVHQQIATLLASADKLRLKVVQPYETIATLTRNLQRLHVVCDLLRKVIRIVRLSKRFKAHANQDSPELRRAAQGELKELDELKGIKVVEEELMYIKSLAQ